MKNIYYSILVSVCFLFFFENINAEIITDLPKIQTPGIIKLSAVSPVQSDSIYWIVSSYFINENDNQFTESSDSIFTKGESIDILLTKKIGSYTFYKILAYNNSFSDSVKFQVLNKGVPEKYLFYNRSLPDKALVVFIVLPDNISNANFIMIMHGTNRNSLEYISAWKDFGKKYNYVCAAPTFSSEDWPTSVSYNLGNMFQSSNGLGTINPDSIWAFTLISKIHDDLVEALGMNNQQYDIWGHSAGAQFVHRMMTFKPDYKIHYAIAANAGWYTMPDLDIDYPYGLKNNNFNFEETFLEDLVIKNLIIMRGENDIIRDSYLNTSAEADEQGLNRYERALTYFNYASLIDPNHKWKLIDVKDTGHDFNLMAIAAQNYLLQPTSVENKTVFNNEIKLFQNYPNPFNLSTNIYIHIPQTTYKNSFKATLKVYNSIGEEVAVLLDNAEIAGDINCSFEAKDHNGNSLHSGVYYYCLNIGDNLFSNKMVLLK